VTKAKECMRDKTSMIKTKRGFMVLCKLNKKPTFTCYELCKNRCVKTYHPYTHTGALFSFLLGFLIL
jgi:hypothetical protein